MILHMMLMQLYESFVHQLRLSQLLFNAPVYSAAWENIFYTLSEQLHNNCMYMGQKILVFWLVK